MEMKNKDIRETKSSSTRTEFAQRERFDPNKPMNNIAHVNPLSGNRVEVRDANGNKQYFGLQPTEKVMDYNNSFIVVARKDTNGFHYTVRDSKGKNINNMNGRNSVNIGEFRGISGNNMTFEKAGYKQIYDKNFNKIGREFR